ncbi:MAG: undecaprenyl-diphosphatase UppP [Gemmataceae bacterium]|nr:undecaprenyl-diphosphatase UppP [Gemmataceae bacterium]MDW8242909.1 undecaprenyl-diphosphatase UppP [Thermogemmata sp.]
MQVWEAVLLGFIQGVTEFLPISSTAHLLVVRHLLGHQHPEDAFTVVIQLGSMVAVLAYFRRDLLRLICGAWEVVRCGAKRLSPDGRWALLIAWGTLPAAMVGYWGQHWLKTHFFTLPAVGVVSLIFAVLLASAEGWSRYRRRQGRPERQEADLGWADALWIGLWQACALMPGGSRSGTTISGALFVGLSRAAAARFSFVLALPIIVAAGLKELYDEYRLWRQPVPALPQSLFASVQEWSALAVGLVVSTVVSYVAIAFLLHFVRRHSLGVFVVYRLGFGLSVLMLWYWGK